MDTNTSLNEVYDLFLQLVQDYKLMDLFNTSEVDFENYVQAWLEFAITDFNMCDQNLDFDDTTKKFSSVLTRDNKNILDSLMMKYWLTKTVNDITQINLHITDRDFKVASEAQNLKEKSAHLNMVRESCSQLLVDYGYKRVDWSSWLNQNFMGS